MARIAIIDPVLDNAEMLQTVLYQAGYSVQTFGSGPEFLKCFRAGAFDLISLEIALPKLDGYELFNRIRKIDRHVPMITITTCAFSRDRERALRHGFSLHVSKPILDLNTFVEQISEQIARSSLLLIRKF